MKILIAAGGTGGHLYPALSVARELKGRGAEVLFAVHPTPLTRDALNREGFSFQPIPSAPLLGRGLGSWVFGIWNNLRGIRAALALIARFRPDRAVGFGAYASFPTLCAARLKSVPIVIHEQNVVPGWANRILGFWAGKVAVSFPETGSRFPGKAVLTGNPVREEVRSPTTNRLPTDLGLAKGIRTVLVFGGSGGSQSLNQALVSVSKKLESWKTSLQWIHLTGRSEWIRPLEERYQALGFRHCVQAYSNEMGTLFKLADLVICRAGASTVSELIALRKPAILVPYPHAGGHQDRNAEVLARLGAGVVVAEGKGWEERLTETVRAVLTEPGRLDTMKSGYEKFPVSLERAPALIADLIDETHL